MAPVRSDVMNRTGNELQDRLVEQYSAAEAALAGHGAHAVNLVAVCRNLLELVRLMAPIVVRAAMDQGRDGPLVAEVIDPTRPQ